MVAPVYWQNVSGRQTLQIRVIYMFRAYQKCRGCFERLNNVKHTLDALEFR